NVTRPELGHLGHKLPLLQAQRKRLQTHQQEQRTKTKAEGETGETVVGGSSEAAHAVKLDKQVHKLLKVQENRQRRPGPELGPFKVLREVGLQQGTTTEKVELGASCD